MNVEIKITENPLDLAICQSFVELPEVGGIVNFVGTVRNHTKNRAVMYLEFEAYQAMALKEMKKIGEKALETYDIHRIAIHHRLGKLAIGEVPVIISVSSSHRKEAFKACEYAIDTLKQTVPIWKKEFFEDGEVWVSATP
jgi:molybdopterin synthase catalytic subunit